MRPEHWSYCAKLHSLGWFLYDGATTPSAIRHHDHHHHIAAVGLPHIKLNPSPDEHCDHNPPVFITASGSEHAHCPRTRKLSQKQKSNQAQEALWRKGFGEKWFGECVGNEMLLVSDSKGAYQLVAPRCLSLPAPLLFPLSARLHGGFRRHFEKK